MTLALIKFTMKINYFFYRQVRNAQQFGRRKLLFNPDVSFTLNDIVGLDKFIKNIESSPDVIVLMHDSELWKDFRTQLMNPHDELPHICWSYEVCDFAFLLLIVLLLLDK